MYAATLKFLPITTLLTALFVLLVVYTSSILIHYATVNSLWLQFVALQVTSDVIHIQESKDVLEKIYLFREEDKNIHRLLGYANASTGSEEVALQYWQMVPGIELELLEQADRFWYNHDYRQAIAWYARALEIEIPPPYQAVFRCVVASVISDQPVPKPCATENVPIANFSGGRLQINGEELQWLNPLPFFNVSSGDKLAAYPPASPNAGVMWWSGEALTIVDVYSAQAVELVVRVQALQTDTLFNIAHNNMRIATLQARVNAISEYSVYQPLDKGLNVLSIEFPTDSGDLVLHSIEIRNDNIDYVK